MVSNMKIKNYLVNSLCLDMIMNYKEWQDVPASGEQINGHYTYRYPYFFNSRKNIKFYYKCNIKEKDVFYSEDEKYLTLTYESECKEKIIIKLSEKEEKVLHSYMERSRSLRLINVLSTDDINNLIKSLETKKGKLLKNLNLLEGI